MPSNRTEDPVNVIVVKHLVRKLQELNLARSVLQEAREELARKIERYRLDETEAEKHIEALHEWLDTWAPNWKAEVQ